MSIGANKRGKNQEARLIVHVIWRLSIGGLENGLVNLINGLPARKYRHAIVCLDRSTEFRHRIKRRDVEIVEIRKNPGFDFKALVRLYRTFKRLRPDIVHTRNIAALDALLPALVAGVKIRIHGEHGWNVTDLHGTRRKPRWLRKLHSPLVTQYVAISDDIFEYLVKRVGVDARRVSVIRNGVDIKKFCQNPDKRADRRILTDIFAGDTCVIGAAGRMDPVKDYTNLAAAFITMLKEYPECRNARLAIVGDGVMYEKVSDMLRSADLDGLWWMPGRRDDIARIVGCFDVFVQPSLAEGISNTILEAMASGLPVIATNVGGNPELVKHATTGIIIPPADTGKLVSAMRDYTLNGQLRAAHGAAGRARAVGTLSVDRMLRRYVELYDGTLAQLR